MPSDVAEIVVCREHRHIVANAELRQQCIDRADLNSDAAAAVAQLRSLDVIAPIGNEQRQSRKPIEYPFAHSGAGKALHQFLQDQTGGEQSLAGLDRPH